MPWMCGDKKYPDTGQPSRYIWPCLLSDDTVLGKNIEYAKQQRKEIGQLREFIIGVQKECSKKKDINGARLLSDEASELMKQYRGWDNAIKIICDTENNWTHNHISEPIAPYVDRALQFMDLQN